MDIIDFIINWFAGHTYEFRQWLNNEISDTHAAYSMQGNGWTRDELEKTLDNQAGTIAYKAGKREENDRLMNAIGYLNDKQDPIHLIKTDRIQAIKQLKDAKRLGLKEAKWMTDLVKAGLDLQKPQEQPQEASRDVILARRVLRELDGAMRPLTDLEFEAIKILVGDKKEFSGE